MPTALGIAVAAAAGALSRYGLERAFPVSADGTHYVGTLAVNLAGAFALGLLTGALGARFVEQPLLRNVLTVGFLSSFTTFSALAYQAVHLAEGGRTAVAAAYVAGTLAGGIALAYAGLTLGRAVA